jgi:hypothetical protein
LGLASSKAPIFLKITTTKQYKEKRVMEFIKRIDYKKVLLVAVLGFICFNIASFDIISLQVQSERLNKKICIQEMIPSQPPLEVIQ